MKVVDYHELYTSLKAKEEKLVHLLNRDPNIDTLPASHTSWNQYYKMVDARSSALNTLLTEIRDILGRDIFYSPDYKEMKFYMVTPKSFPRLKRDAPFFHMNYDGTYCKLCVTSNFPNHSKRYFFYIPSVEKLLQENPVK